MEVLRLKEYRKQSKLTQLDISKALKVSQSYYSRLEKGKNLPDALQILELCKIFNCTPNDLFGIRGVHTVVGYEIRNASKLEE